MNARVLCVEDDDQLRALMVAIATDAGFDVVAADTAEAALERLTVSHFDVLVTDVRLPAMSGIDLIPRARQIHPALAVIVTSGQATVDMAVAAMKRGALDFLTKPFKAGSLRTLLRVAASRAMPSAAVSDAGREILGESPAILQLLEQTDRVAPFNVPVLVVGETGTGKELVARRLHARSARLSKPLVALNCAAVPEQLLEDELFGHVKGAFTGAQEAREGRFEQAHEGTLFLDEIGDMALPLQAKLLRVLQEQEFERLGSSRTVEVDVRVVAATSADLDERIRAGTFRPDLYYRLNVVRLDLPPLRARNSDIPLLAQAFLDEFCVRSGLPRKELSREAATALTDYDWPGNVRQLRNAMERAAVMTGTAPAVHVAHLPCEVTDCGRTANASFHLPSFVPTVAPVSDKLPLDTLLRNVERQLLLDALERTGGNKLRAAQLLGVKRTTFNARLRRAQAGDE
jgi:DNA-binding NtrC family response regulator